MKIELEVDDTIKRTVRTSGTSGRVNVPKDWEGLDVQVCLLPKKLELDHAVGLEKQMDTLEKRLKKSSY